VKIATIIKAAIFILILIVGVSLWHRFGSETWWHWWGSQNSTQVPPPPPAAGTVKPTEEPPIVHGSSSLPQPDKETTGVVHITIPPDTTKPVSEQKPHVIDIYINKDPEKPPEIRSEMPLQATFSPVVDRWIVLEPKLMLGGSATFDARVSPWGGLSVLRLWKVVNIGAGIDMNSIGPFVGYEFWREFNVGGIWGMVPLSAGQSRGAIFVAYRF